MSAIRAYIETALRIAETEYSLAITTKEKYRLSDVIVGLRFALDSIINE